MCLHFFFFIDTATTGIYTYVHTLSQHDALPIPRRRPPYRKPRLTEPPHRDGRPFTVGTDEDVCPTCNGSGRVLNAVPTEWRGSQISGLYRYPTNKIDRKRVVSGKSVSVRVDQGCRGYIHKITNSHPCMQ